jgi:quercetin dioxygenase-like cupin family protein
MQKYNLSVLIECDDERFSPKILMNKPGYRMELLRMRAGQLIPEHASKEMVTVQAILGHITLFAGSFPNELYVGEVICIESAVPHRIEAIEDSALLVLYTGGSDSSTAHSEEMDLWQVLRTQRHPRGGGLPSSVSSHMRGSENDISAL